MTQIKISKSELKRLASFAAFAKSCSAVVPLNERHLFVLDQDKKLEVYADADQQGGDALVRIRLDLIDVQPQPSDKIYFVISSSAFHAAAEKIPCDEVKISIDEKHENKLAFTGDGSRSRVSLSPNVQRDPDEVDEIREKLDKERDAAQKKAVKLDVTEELFDDLTRTAQLTKILSHSGDIEVSDKEIKAADELCIVSLRHATGVSETVYVGRDLVPLLKEAKSLTMYGNGNRKVMFSVENKGINAYFQLSDVSYEFPSEAELLGFIPAGDGVAITVTAEKLFETLDAFDGIFDAASWRFKQVRIKYDKDDVAKSKELEVFYDDLKAECQQYLPIESVVDASSKKSFQIVMATIHLVGALRSLLEKEGTVTFRFNGLSQGAPNGMGIEVTTSRAQIVIPKMIE